MLTGGGCVVLAAPTSSCGLWRTTFVTPALRMKMLPLRLPKAIASATSSLLSAMWVVASCVGEGRRGKSPRGHAQTAHDTHAEEQAYFLLPRKACESEGRVRVEERWGRCLSVLTSPRAVHLARLSFER